MIATQNQTNQKENLDLVSEAEEAEASLHLASENALSKVRNFSSPLLLPSRSITHNLNAGLNPLVDAAGYLFSIVGKLKQLSTYRQLNKLQKELTQEINTFYEIINNQGYNAEYILICRYILCATIDDILSNTAWGGQGQWESFSLLAAFNQDTQHQDKFFTIMERAVKEPAFYIDLMELMYICLSTGYKGQYRSTEHNQFQLEQITNNLYKHIRAYRGAFSKTLSPTPIKASKMHSKTVAKSRTSYIFIFFVTGCLIMTIFVSLGYLMDVISNEAYKNISQIQQPVSKETLRL